MSDGDTIQRHAEGFVEEGTFLHAVLGALSGSAALGQVLDTWAPPLAGRPPAGPIGGIDSPAVLALLGLIALGERVRAAAALAAGPAGVAFPSPLEVALPRAPRELSR